MGELLRRVAAVAAVWAGGTLPSPEMMMRGVLIEQPVLRSIDVSQQTTSCKCKGVTACVHDVIEQRCGRGTAFPRPPRCGDHASECG